MTNLDDYYDEQFMDTVKWSLEACFDCEETPSIIEANNDTIQRIYRVATRLRLVKADADVLTICDAFSLDGILTFIHNNDIPDREYMILNEAKDVIYRSKPFLGIN